MTRTSFPWEKTSSTDTPGKGYPWEKAESTLKTFPWQKQVEEVESTRFPWESKPAASTNPFGVKKASFPWEKTSSTVPAQESSPADVFVFGKKNTGTVKPGGGTYSSIYRENNNSQSSLSNKTDGGGGTYSSIYRENNEKKALFPWEKARQNTEEDDSLEAQLSEYLKMPPKQETQEKITITKAEVKAEKQTPGSESKQPKSPKSPKSPKNKQKTKTTRKASEKTTDRDTLVAMETKEDRKPEMKFNIEVPTAEDQASSVNLDSSKADDVSKKKEESALKDDLKTVTSPTVGSPKELTKSASVTKLVTKEKPERVKSAPLVPRHINKKSEALARKYMSAYAKPRIPMKKPDEDIPPDTKKSFRQEQSISEWVYPAPTEPVDWKIKSDRNIPETESEIKTESETNMDSTSLREAAFQKWIEKKKQNNTFKKADLVTVIDNKGGVPSAEAIRQARFEEWYRNRTVTADTKHKEKIAEEERKRKEEEEAKEEKLKKEKISRQVWEEKDKERKEKIRKEKEEKAKKIKQKKEEEAEKKKNAEKTYKMWAEKKDPTLKKQAKKKKLEQKRVEEEKRDEQEMKEIEAQKSFKAWKEAKEQELKEKKEKENTEKRKKQEQLAKEKREKEIARVKQLEQWEARKEQERSEIHIPAHISPWKDGTKPNFVISRDEKLMADIKFKKSKQKQRPKKQTANTETEVEFVR